MRQKSQQNQNAIDTPDAPKSGRARAIVDLVLVFTVTSAVWSLRFAGVPQVGALTMAAGLICVGFLLYRRQQSLRSIGLTWPISAAETIKPTLKLLGWFGAVWLLVGGLVTFFLGSPETSSAITQQPQTWWLFVLDITVVTWILIAFGEEVIFRGFILRNLLLLFGESPLARGIAVGTQAVWFGLGHASQGLAGIILTMAIGATFGWFFLTQARRSLWPLILVHGTVDSIVLTVAYLT